MSKTRTPLPALNRPVKGKLYIPPQLLERLHYLTPEDIEAISRCPKPSNDEILGIIDQQIEAFADFPSKDSGNAHVCRCLIELVILMLERPKAPAVSKTNINKLKVASGVLKRDLSWYLNNTLETYLDDILSRRMGEIEAVTLLYDTLTEAKQVTAAYDSFDRKSREWHYSREGRKWAACYDGSYTSREMKEAA